MRLGPVGKRSVVRPYLVGISPKQVLLDKSLISAARNGDNTKLQSMLLSGADVNAEDNDGLTAIKHAKKKGHKQIVELLKQLLHTVKYWAEKEEPPQKEKMNANHG